MKLLAIGVLLAVPLPGHDGSQPVWTNGELISWLGTVALATAGGVWGLVRLAYDYRLSSLKKKGKRLENELARAAEVQALYDEAKAKIATAVETLADRDERLAQVEENNSGLKGKLRDCDKRLGIVTGRIRRAVKIQGRLWEEKVPPAQEKRFKPLGEQRTTPIISVLNLKGGVGKTTVVANLGAALASLGHKVLLVDLDLQGSLTNLFIPPYDGNPGKVSQYNLYEKELLLENFFQKAAADPATKIRHYVQRSGAVPGLSVVPTADTLAYTEQSLSLQWLLRAGGRRDPRFLLRKALHLKQVSKHYDYVLLDCPPLLTLSCVNALAASDYFFVPVLLSKQSTARVPTLLNIVKTFKERKVNPAIELLGIIANRTNRAPLGAAEQNIWADLKNNCADIWPNVKMCQTTIPLNVSIRNAEEESRPLATGDNTFPVFVKLASELKQQIETRQQKRMLLS
jgi:chromosome partitioning protein